MRVGDLRIDNFTLPVIILIVFNFALLPLVVFGMDASLGKKAAPAAPPKGDQAESLPLASGPLVAITTGATAPGVPPDTSRRAATPETPKSFLSDPLIVAGVVVFIFLNGVAKGVLTLSECGEQGRRCTGGILYTTLFCAAVETIASSLFGVRWLPFVLFRACGLPDLPPRPSLRQNVYGDSGTPDPSGCGGSSSQATGLWFTYLGLVGLVVYAGMAVKRPKWAPSDFNLCLVSCVACAVGGLILAHPASPSLDKGSLNVGAVLIWSVGAPISDVVAVSVGQARGILVS